MGMKMDFLDRCPLGNLSGILYIRVLGSSLD